MHNFEQKVVASFAMNLEFSYSVLIKTFKTILGFFLVACIFAVTKLSHANIVYFALPFS